MSCKPGAQIGEFEYVDDGVEWDLEYEDGGDTGAAEFAAACPGCGAVMVFRLECLATDNGTESD